ncbi:hypothetical protein CSUI_006550, partial [Cystoisospora suis]
ERPSWEEKQQEGGRRKGRKKTEMPPPWMQGLEEAFSLSLTSSFDRSPSFGFSHPSAVSFSSSSPGKKKGTERKKMERG